MAASRLSAALLLLAAAACSSTPSIQPEPSATTTTTARSITTGTSAPVPVVTPAVGPAPVGVDPSSACMRRAVFGDPADSDYLLPYPPGERYRVSQSYCRTDGGHRLQLAFDFVMPVGAEVIAARSGMVIDMRSDSPDDGRGPGEHNYLMIRHDDGTAAFYAHLMQDGLVVELGDRVEAGDLIAYAGNSGQTNGPHLHFGVYASWPPIEGSDVPVVFRNAAGELDLLGGLATDRLYEALPAGDPVPSRKPRPPSQYPGTALTGVTLSGANLWGYAFGGADLTGADLSGSILTGADFEGATLAGADLTFARLQYARFRDADLNGALLARTDLSSADLRDADLSGADLSYAYAAAADLRGADLSGAVLEGARLPGIDWDERTRWPTGYQPPPRP